MKLPEAYARLREHFGSHGKAAEELGITQQHYNALRNGRVNIPRRTADYIILKASDLADAPAPPPTPTDEVRA